MPQILGVEGEAAPPGRGRRTLDNAGDTVSSAFQQSIKNLELAYISSF